MKFGLTDEFAAKVDQLLHACWNRGIYMLPVEGLRHPVVQAQYWKQSRTAEEISLKIEELRDLNCIYLATILETSSYRTNGAQITNAIPGLSWHQWGEAVDCCWMVRGKPLWSITERIDGINGFELYSEEASRLGLNSGLRWETVKDGPHIQLRKNSSPSNIYPLQEIDAIMKARFSANTKWKHHS